MPNHDDSSTLSLETTILSISWHPCQSAGVNQGLLSLLFRIIIRARPNGQIGEIALRARKNEAERVADQQ